MQLRSLFKSETIAESAGIVLAFTIIRQILQIGRGIVFVRFLGPSEYGAYTLAFFFIPIVAAVARLGIPSSFLRYIPQYERKGMLEDFLGRTYVMLAGASALLALLLIAFPGTVSNLIYGTPGYKLVIVICSLSILPLSLQESLAQTFNGLRIYKLSNLMVFFQFMIFSVLGVVLVVIFKTAATALSSYLVSLILVVILFGVLLLKYMRSLDGQAKKIDEGNFRTKIFRYSVWFIISPIVFNLFRYVDRWMINYFLGLEEVGIYSVAMNVTALLFAFGIVVGNVLLPTLSGLWEEGKKEKALSILDFSVRANTLLLFSGALLLMLFKNPIIIGIYGSEYAGGTGIVGVLIIFWLLNTVYWTMSNYSGLVEKTYIPLVCNLTGLIGNIILNYLFIPRFGIAGAAAASTAAFGLTLLMMAVWVWVIGFRLRAKTIFVCLLPCLFLLDVRIVAAAFVLVLAASFATELLLTREERKELAGKLKGLVGKSLGRARRES